MECFASSLFVSNSGTCVELRTMLMAQYIFNINHKPFGSGAFWDEKTAIIAAFFESQYPASWIVKRKTFIHLYQSSRVCFIQMLCCSFLLLRLPASVRKVIFSRSTKNASGLTSAFPQKRQTLNSGKPYQRGFLHGESSVGWQKRRGGSHGTSRLI